MFQAQSAQGNTYNLGKIKTLEKPCYMSSDYLKNNEGPKPRPHNLGTYIYRL